MIGKIGGQPGTAPLRPATARLDLGQALEKVAEVAKTAPKLGTDKLDKAKLDATDLWAEAAEEPGDEVGQETWGAVDETSRLDGADTQLVSIRARQSGGGGEGTLV